MKITRKKIRKMISESLLKEGSFLGSGVADYLLPDFIEDELTKMSEETKLAIKKYIKEEVAKYVLDNASDMSRSAPYGTQTIVESFLKAKANEIGDCAAGLFVGE